MSEQVVPLVSVCCLTYNHAAFIGEALDSLVSQVTDFPYEVVVHDDASTDGTADIVRSYAARYPDRIRPILQRVNQYSLEYGRVMRTCQDAARGEFIALCEGDDLWIDSGKLQAQVDHLRAHPAQVFCFTNAWNQYDDGRRVDYVRSWLNVPVPPSEFHQRDIVAFNFVPTAGVLYRRALLEGFTKEQRKAMAYDWVQHVLLSSLGPFGYLDRISAVRRVHEGGVISMKDTAAKVRRNQQLLDQIDALTEHRYTGRLDDRRIELDRSAIRFAIDTGQPERGRPALRHLVARAPLRRKVPAMELLRDAILLYAPGLGRLIHRLRGGARTA